jgi:hypothetical protein
MNAVEQEFGKKMTTKRGFVLQRMNVPGFQRSFHFV